MNLQAGARKVCVTCGKRGRRLRELNPQIDCFLKVIHLKLSLAHSWLHTSLVGLELHNSVKALTAFYAMFFTKTKLSTQNRC